MSDKLTNAERELFFYLNGRTGSFMTHLFDAIFAADYSNKMKLSIAFPDEVEAVRKLQNEPEYHSRLQTLMTVR